MVDRIGSDIVVRVWTPDLRQEGARFKATLARRDVTFRARVDGSLDVEDVTRPGLVIIGESDGPGGNSPVDLTIRAIPDEIKLTILDTDELLWLPVAATRDALGMWHIEAVPLAEWLRVKLRNQPKVTR